MRKYANIEKVDPLSGECIKRIILYTGQSGTTLYLLNTTEDDGAQWELQFKSQSEAEVAALKLYKIKSTEWIKAHDPCEDCAPDYLRPVRIIENPQGQIFMEELIEDHWLPLH